METKSNFFHSVQFKFILILLVSIFSVFVFIKNKPTDNLALPKGGDFTINDSKGLVSLKDFYGKAVILYFGYTYCPDMCPLGLGFLSQALNKLSPEEQVKTVFLFITLDPDRDSLETLDKYLSFFHPQMKGLRTDSASLKKITQQYGVQFKKQGENDKYTIDHTTEVFFINYKGEVVEKLPHNMNPESYVKVIKTLY